MEPKIIGERVRALIKKNKMTQEEVSSAIGIRTELLEKKLQGKKEFYVDEIIKIIKLFNLNLEECEKIFFSEGESASRLTK